MKLLTKTTLYFLITLIPLLAVAGFYLFNQFSKEINYRSDKELISNEIAWVQYLESEVSNGTTFILRTPDLAIFPTQSAIAEHPTIINTSGYEKNEKGIPYRQLSQVVSISGIAYQITIRKSQEQKAALVTDVTRIMLFVFIGLFAATLIFNWAISKKLWMPFRRSLNKIRSVELQKMENVHFEETNIKEFNELNASLNYMKNRIYKDYVNMKEFTENAAHEMQTPVAVVLSKLELLMQDSNLKDEQIQAILQSTDALRQLGKLNESLLLLAKIENNQFETTTEVSLSDVTQKYIRLFDEFIKEKQLTVQTIFNDSFTIQLHPLLADSLIINLLGNAIKYNYNGGNIVIAIDENKFRISNTSALSPIPPDKLFKRLSTSNTNKEISHGLGLAIVKKITDENHLNIEYHVANNVHNFVITKP
ncbi:MAG: HAMP domain-containing sensor histidine kinase [Ginsengibacter sp.]